MELMSRRRVLRAGAGIAAAGCLPLSRTARANPLGLPIGLQAYTVGDQMGKDFEGTLRQVAAIGYGQIEMGLTAGTKTPAEIRRFVDSIGLGWVSIHVNAFQDIADANRQKTIDDAAAIGIKYMICAIPAMRPKGSGPKGMRDFVATLTSMSLDDWKWNADFLNKTGEQAKKSGIQFGYHNHNVEFRVIDGKLPYDALLRLTDPALVTMELDCGWMVSAGHDPVAYFHQYPGRFSLLHIKDLKQSFIPNTELKMRGTEIGSGIVDWKRLFTGAKAEAVRGYYVEQEPPFDRPTLEAAKISYDYLKNLAV